MQPRWTWPHDTTSAFRCWDNSSMSPLLTRSWFWKDGSHCCVKNWQQVWLPNFSTNYDQQEWLWKHRFHTGDVVQWQIAYLTHQNPALQNLIIINMENAYQDANPRVCNSLNLVWQTSFQEPLKVTIKPTVCGVSEVYRNKYGTCRGPDLTSQHSHGDSQSAVTPVSGESDVVTSMGTKNVHSV